MSGLRKIGTSLHWSGLLVASLLWAVNTQARYSATISFLGAAVACLSGAPRLGHFGVADRSPGYRTWIFVGSMSVLAALVFAFALSMQGLAGLVLSGCER
jgi:hypothetical protein